MTLVKYKLPAAHNIDSGEGGGDGGGGGGGGRGLGSVGGRAGVTDCNILPPTTAMIDYAIGLEKLSAKRQFFVVAQMAVSL